ERIGDGVAILFNSDRRPFPESELAIIAAAGNAGGAALLLAAAHAIGKVVVGVDVIHLRRGLVVPGTPGGAAIHRNDGTLVADVQNDIGIVGIDPDALIIVPSRSA